MCDAQVEDQHHNDAQQTMKTVHMNEHNLLHLQEVLVCALPCDTELLVRGLLLAQADSATQVS